MTDPTPQTVPLPGDIPPQHIRLAPNGPNGEFIPGPPPAQPETDPEVEAREIQALSEGVTLVDRVEVLGGHYRIKDKVGLMPLMKFAHVSKKVDEEDLEALVCIFNMMKSCIHPTDWERFETDMTEKDADMEDLMPVVAQTMELLAARPTRQSSGSSDGRSTTGPTSTPTSSSAELAAPVPDWVKDTVPVDPRAQLA